MRVRVRVRERVRVRVGARVRARVRARVSVAKPMDRTSVVTRGCPASGERIVTVTPSMREGQG